MTDKHRSPEWMKTVRLVRAKVRVAQARGDEVTCWRCGRELPLDANGKYIFDVGHVDRMSDDNSISNAAPEHRTKTGTCIGNRNHGGRIGAAITNQGKGSPNAFKAPNWA